MQSEHAEHTEHSEHAEHTEHAELAEHAERRPIPPSALTGALVALGALLGVLAVKTPWSTQPRWLIAVAAAGGCAALVGHRRWPVAVTAVGALSYVLSGDPWALGVGLFAVGYSLRPRRVALAAGVALVGLATQEWIEAGRLSFAAISGAVVLTVVVAGAGGYLGTRAALMRAVQARAAHADAERDLRMERARSNERERIAREMHDVLAHKLSLIALHAGALEVGPFAEAAPVHTAASLIRTTARDALGELRDILGRLRLDPAGGTEPSGPDQFGDLGRLVGDWTRAGADVSLDDTAGPLPSATGRAAYRLVQEGLTNAHKHAPGAPVTVALRGGGGREVVITVSNGVATGPRPAHQAEGGGFGLVGLAERFRLVGGSVRSGLGHDGRWCLEGRLPWVPQERVEPAPAGPRR